MVQEVMAALTFYDAIKKFCDEHGVDIDKAVKSLLSSVLHSGGGLTVGDMANAWDAAMGQEPTEEEFVEVLKNTPYDDGDITEEYDDENVDEPAEGNVDFEPEANGEGACDGDSCGTAGKSSGFKGLDLNALKEMWETLTGNLTKDI